MDASGANAGAQAAIATLKESVAIGKEGGKLVAEIQSDNYNVINQQHQRRQAERHKLENLGSEQEQIAYTQFLNKNKQGTATAELKAHITKVHGAKAWEEFLAIKTEVEKQYQIELNSIHTDEEKLNDAMWWCIAAGALVSYFLVVA
jgi:hypothetical protein